MFAIPGIAALLVVVFVRPQEIWPDLYRVPLLHICAALTLAGWAVDVRLKLTRATPSPLLPWTTACVVWSIVTVVAVARPAIIVEVQRAAVSFFLFLAISQGIQSFRGLKTLGVFVLGLSLFLTTVAIDQAFEPQTCVRRVAVGPRDSFVPDGRACQSDESCNENAPEPEVRYRCEHVGWLGTTSIERRVRYRGIMQDPNELAMVISIALPFAFVVFQQRRTISRLALLIAAIGAVGLCTILTKSRSGQLAFLAVVGICTLRYVRGWGVLVAALIGAPVILLGGRSGESASQSTDDRLMAWSEAIWMWQRSPIFGVGKGQFLEHYVQTAHNSFLLAIGETGAPGILLWSASAYLALKILFTISGRKLQPEAEVAQTWGMALLASLSGLMIAAFFLSLTDHHVFWIYLGLVGAFCGAIQRHAPSFRPRLRWRELAMVALFDAVLVVAIGAYSRAKGF